MDPLQKLLAGLAIEEAQQEARIGVIEGIIPDFFRLYLGAETADPDEVKDGLAKMSEKLLAMQAEALEIRKLSRAKLDDLKRGMMERAAADAERVQGETEAGDAETVPDAVPSLAVVPEGSAD